jgi:hypothetical protein
VLPLSRAEQEPPLAPPEHPLELLVAPTDKADLVWLVDVVAPALGGIPVREIPATMHGASWWGTSKLVEAVGVPSNLERLAQVTLSGVPAPCAWCGEPIFASPCPFCGEAVSPGGHARLRPSSGDPGGLAVGGN